MKESLREAIEIILKMPEGEELGTFQQTMKYIGERMSPELFAELKSVSLLDILSTVKLGSLIGE